MQTTITSKSGKTYEITTEPCEWKTRGRWVTDENGRVIIDADGNAVTEGGGDDIVYAYVDGKRIGHYTAATQAEIDKKVLAAAKRHVETQEADEHWFPKAKLVAANFTYSDRTDIYGTSAADFFVGQKVAVWGHNGGRVGLVEKVGKKNVGVIYVVASSGAMWRKSMAFDKVVILDLGPSDDELGDEPCDCGCHYSRSTKDTGVYDPEGFDPRNFGGWCCQCWLDANPRSRHQDS